MGIKHAQVSDYAGKSLNCNASYNSKIYIDPNMERAKDILVWFYELDDDSRSEIRSISKGIVLDAHPQTNDFLDQKFMKNPFEKPKVKDINEYMTVVRRDDEEVESMTGEATKSQSG